MLYLYKTELSFSHRVMNIRLVLLLRAKAILSFRKTATPKHAKYIYIWRKELLLHKLQSTHEWLIRDYY